VKSVPRAPSGEPAHGKSAADDRRALLEEAPLALGETWANSRRDELRREGRSASGGWPGTMREARARVMELLGRELALRHLPLLTSDELGLAARAAYSAARRVWLAMPSSRRKR